MIFATCRFHVWVPELQIITWLKTVHQDDGVFNLGWKVGHPVSSPTITNQGMDFVLTFLCPLPIALGDEEVAWTVGEEDGDHHGQGAGYRRGGEQERPQQLVTWTTEQYSMLSGLILVLCPTNGGSRYKVTPSPIVWTQT